MTWNKVGNLLGPVGPVGNQGPDGNQGPVGTVQGPQGNQGPQGIQGSNGPANAVFEMYSVSLTYTDNAVFDQPGATHFVGNITQPTIINPYSPTYGSFYNYGEVGGTVPVSGLWAFGCALHIDTPENTPGRFIVDWSGATHVSPVYFREEVDAAYNANQYPSVCHTVKKLLNVGDNITPFIFISGMGGNVPVNGTIWFHLEQTF